MLEKLRNKYLLKVDTNCISGTFKPTEQFSYDPIASTYTVFEEWKQWVIEEQRETNKDIINSLGFSKKQYESFTVFKAIIITDKETIVIETEIFL